MNDAPTPRELACLRLLARKGSSYKAVALALGIGEGTVKQHLSHLYRKLEVNSALQAREELETRARAAYTGS